MIDISAMVSLDGEVIPASDFKSEIEFEFKILNALNFESVRSFFIKKTIIEAVKEKHKTSNGKNGITTVELLNIFKWNDIELYVKELEEKKVITKREGVNLEMYFICKKQKL